MHNYLNPLGKGMFELPGDFDKTKIYTIYFHFFNRSDPGGTALVPNVDYELLENNFRKAVRINYTQFHPNDKVSLFYQGDCGCKQVESVPSKEETVTPPEELPKVEVAAELKAEEAKPESGEEDKAVAKPGRKSKILGEAVLAE